MRQDFDQSVPIEEQISRRIKVHTGHKHQHRPGPGRPRKNRNPTIAAKFRKLKALVRSYWRGEVDECP